VQTIFAEKQVSRKLEGSHGGKRGRGKICRALRKLQIRPIGIKKKEV